MDTQWIQSMIMYYRMMKVAIPEEQEEFRNFEQSKTHQLIEAHKQLQEAIARRTITAIPIISSNHNLDNDSFAKNVLNTIIPNMFKILQHDFPKEKSFGFIVLSCNGNCYYDLANECSFLPERKLSAWESAAFQIQNLHLQNLHVIKFKKDFDTVLYFWIDLES